MVDFSRFNQLLKSNDYNILEYFSYNKYCNLVKVIHILSGTIYFISIIKDYKLDIPPDIINSYKLTREELKTKEFPSTQLSDYYPMIEFNPELTNGTDDITDQIKISYRQPISIKTSTAFDYINQLKRFKYCFKTLEYKLLLQSEQYIVNLNLENMIDIFKVENYPKTNTYTFYIVVTLEQFYSKMNTLQDIVQQVESDFYNILDMNQEKHTQYLNSQYIDYFIKNNEKLLNEKQVLHKSYDDLCKLLVNLQEKEQICQDKYTKLEAIKTHNIFKDAEKSKEKEKISNILNKIKTTKLQILDKMVNLDIKIKNIYLTLDKLGFNLSISFNELKTELPRMLS